jgi:hypothetical protein
LRAPLGIVVAIAALAVPVAASAETRYASPTGSGFACTEAAPCDIKVALMDERDGDAGIDAGDSVRLAEGVYAGRVDSDSNTYSPGDELRIAKSSVEVYGSTTGVSLSMGARIFVANPTGLVLTATDARVRDVLIWGTSANTESALTVRGAGSRYLQRIFASSPGRAGCQISGNNTIMTNSLCRGQNGAVLTFPTSGTGGQRLQNVTAVTLGSGNGIAASADGTVTATLTLINVISRGANVDISATTTGSGRLEVTASASNFRTRSAFGMRASVTEPGSGLNKTVDPGFGYYGALADQYFRLGPDSPMIDAGVRLTTVPSLYDLYGVPATIGIRSVGAYDDNPGLTPLPTPPAPPAEVLEQIGGTAGATVTPPADPDPHAGGTTGGGAVAATVSLQRPRATIRRTGIAVRSRVTVPGAGTITQRIAARSGKRLRTICTARIDVLQAGAMPITCQLGRKVRVALRARPQRLVITTRFTTATSSAQRVHRINLKRRG